MKLKTLLSTFLMLSLAGGAFAAEDETPLGKEMSNMNKSLRTIKRQLADPAKKAENLELIGKVQKSLEATLALEPKKTKDQADKKAYVTKFKDEITDLGKTVKDLETAIKADKADDAKKAMDKIYSTKEKGHKDFGVDDD